MELQLLTPRQLKKIYDTVLREAFPPEELKSYFVMCCLIRRGCYFPYALREGERELGYALLWTEKPDSPFVLIDYLCVPASLRNQGIGGQMMQQLFTQFPRNTYLWEAELPEEPGIALKQRRIDFYLRQGGRKLSYQVGLFGVKFCVFAHGPEEEKESVLFRRHQAIWRRHVPQILCKRCVRFPLEEGGTDPVFPSGNFGKRGDAE